MVTPDRLVADELAAVRLMAQIMVLNDRDKMDMPPAMALALAVQAEAGEQLRVVLEQIVSPRSGHLSADALRAIARDGLLALAAVPA